MISSIICSFTNLLSHVVCLNKMKKLLFCICIAVLLSGFSYADIESGVYINPTAGYATKSNFTGKHSTDNNSYSLGVFAGYSFDKYWAIDGNLTYLPNKSDNQFNNFFLSGAAVRGSIWFSSVFSPYIRVGGGFLSNASDNLQTSAGVFLGIGGLLEINKSIGITFDNYGILVPTAPQNNFSIVSIGFDYGF